MNILVCVKQVPDTSEIKIDPVTSRIIRKGVPSILNTYDEYALEKALEIKDSLENVNITVLSMGPKQVELMLRDILSLGADKAYLVTDPRFGGSDTLATSYILVEAIKQIEQKNGKFDLIFCGKQAIDGDTAQVGPEIAGKLDIPQITSATSIKVIKDKVNVIKLLDEMSLTIESALPCLVTFTKTDNLRFPTMKNKIKARNYEIETLNLASLENIDTTKIGLKGSPTKVKKTYTNRVKKDNLIFNDDNSKDAVSKLVKLLGL